jgi:hypothetical protein
MLLETLAPVVGGEPIGRMGERTRMQPIQTISKIPCHINILPIIQIPLYQNLSIKVKQLQALGMSYEGITKELNISESTVLRAIKYTK